MPLVVQFNKRDLPEIETEEEVLQRWSKTPWPVVFSTATLGEGVEETFNELLQSVYRYTDKSYDLGGKHGLDQASFVAGITGSQTSSSASSAL